MGRRVDGRLDRDINADMNRLKRRVSKGRRILYTVVVIDFISNPGVLTDEEREALKSGDESVENTHYVDRMPRNSILAKIVSDGMGKSSNKPQIFYPLFSPHLCLPVKAGEQVWVIYEKPDSTIGYWISRKTTNVTVDDINYTHLDRISNPQSTGVQTTIQKYNDEASTDFDPYSYPPGGRGVSANNTLSTQPGGSNPYDDIVENSISYQNYFTGEPVVRHTKTPSGLVIQGSNNTLISLDRDRAGSVGTSNKEGSGTIDIVVGRGQTTDTMSTGQDDPQKNAREYNEIDKTPKLSGAADTASVEMDFLGNNMSEGDPDFVNDLSRIYISMNTDGDVNFETSALSDVSSTGGIADVDSGEGAYCIISSDHNRIVSRSDGTIKIVKKGDNEASIVISADGKITIKGSEIYLGSSSGAATYGFTQAENLETLLESWKSAITDLLRDAGITLQGAAVPPVVGGPVVACITAGSMLQGLILDDPENKFKSSVIKGE